MGNLCRPTTDRLTDKSAYRAAGRSYKAKKCWRMPAFYIVINELIHMSMMNGGMLTYPSNNTNVPNISSLACGRVLSSAGAKGSHWYRASSFWSLQTLFDTSLQHKFSLSASEKLILGSRPALQLPHTISWSMSNPYKQPHIFWIFYIFNFSSKPWPFYLKFPPLATHILLVCNKDIIIFDTFIQNIAANYE